MIFRLICIYTLLTISPLKNLYTRLLELSFVSDFLRVTRCVFDKKQELLSFGEHLASSHFVLFYLVLCLMSNVALGNQELTVHNRSGLGLKTGRSEHL
jgi:hypothetical protein